MLPDPPPPGPPWPTAGARCDEVVDLARGDVRLERREADQPPLLLKPPIAITGSPPVASSMLAALCEPERRRDPAVVRGVPAERLDLGAAHL